MKFPAALLIGFALGVGTVVLLKRLSVALAEEDADLLAGRIDEQLAQLEERAAPSRARA